MIVRVVAEDRDGATRVLEFQPSAEVQSLEGSFDEVFVLLIHLRPESTRLLVNLDIDWNQDSEYIAESISYGRDVGSRTCRSDPTRVQFR